MTLEKENAQKIDEYIAQNPDCKLPKTESVIIKGESKDIQVYKLPLDLLFYNIKNGRFAAEYLELKEKSGRELEPEKADDAKVIQKMLLDLDPKKSLELETNIRKFGQRKPGICTDGGYVIDGNRRMAVLTKLFEDTGEQKFDFINVARIEQAV